MRAYLLLNGKGSPRGIAGTREQAIEMALSMADEYDVYLDAPTEVEDQIVEGVPASRIHEPPMMALAANRAPDHVAVAMNAVTKAGFKLDFDAALSMPLDEAWRRAAPYLPTSKNGKAKMAAYQDPRQTAATFLGQNQKLKKDAPKSLFDKLRAKGFVQASVKGLSLLPNNMVHSSPIVADIISKGRSQYKMKIVDHVGMVSSGRKPVRANLCTKATAECVASCLAFSGQNMNEDYNMARKFAATQLLLRDTDAFMRMLIEAIDMHQRTSLCDNIQPFVRLNVYSDIPWEVAAPGLFARFPDVQFYDYTKVPGRNPAALGIKNYDLTFSFSGSKDNVDSMDSEIRKLKRRVAIVFAVRGLATRDLLDRSGRVRVAKGQEMPLRVKAYVSGKPVEPRLSGTFLGLPLIDGDESDLRPYDPSPCFVGLRWKPPMTQAVTWSAAQIFITEVTLVRNGDAFDAVVAKTPRFDGMDFGDVTS